MPKEEKITGRTLTASQPMRRLAWSRGEIEQLKGEAFGLRVDKQELEQYRALGPIDRLRELAEAALRREQDG